MSYKIQDDTWNYCSFRGILEPLGRNSNHMITIEVSKQNTRGGSAFVISKRTKDNGYSLLGW